jgi:hypothetical protein
MMRCASPFPHAPAPLVAGAVARPPLGLLLCALGLLTTSIAPVFARSDAPQAMLPSVPASAPAPKIGNTAELVRALTRGMPPVNLTPIPALGGCGPQGCDTLIGPVRIDRDHGTLHIDPKDRQLQRIDHGSSDGLALPEIDWASPQAFAVKTGGKAWGTCIRFPHEGLGKSGSAQRWTSVVLVPAERRGVTVQAQRFVGYWASCDALVAGPRAGELVMSVVERTSPAPSVASEASPDAASLQATRYVCVATGCTRLPDPAPVGWDSASGALLWPRSVTQ